MSQGYIEPKAYFRGTEEEEKEFQRLAEHWADGDIVDRTCCFQMAVDHIRIVGCSGEDDVLLDVLERLGEYDATRMTSVVGWINWKYGNKKRDAYRDGEAIGLESAEQDGYDEEVEYQAEEDGNADAGQIARIWDRMVVAYAAILEAEHIMSKTEQQTSCWNHIMFTEFTTKTVKIHPSEGDIASSKMQQHERDVCLHLDPHFLAYIFGEGIWQILEIYRMTLMRGDMKENGYWILKGTELTVYLKEANEKEPRCYPVKIGCSDKSVSDHRRSFEDAMRPSFSSELERMQYYS